MDVCKCGNFGDVSSFRCIPPLSLDLPKQPLLRQYVDRRSSERLPNPQTLVKGLSCPRCFREAGIVRTAIIRPRGDGERGTQAGHGIADIPLVRARHGRAAYLIDILIAGYQVRRVQRVKVTRVSRAQGPVGHVICICPQLRDLQLGSSGLRTSSEARADLRTKLFQPALRRRARDEYPGCVRVDYVGRYAAVGDVALYDVTGHRLLAKHGDGVVRRDERVQRVDALPWLGCRVGLAAEILHLKPGVCGSTHERRVGDGARVGYQADVYPKIAVSTGVEELDLAPAALLCWGAEYDDLAGEVMVGDDVGCCQRAR
jgi:hypothetical protein